VSDLALGSAYQRALPLLRAAWAWWIGELASLLPATMQRAVAGLRRRLVLSIEGESARLAWEAGDRREMLGLVDLAAAEPSEIRALLSQPGQNRALPPVTLRLDDASALRAPMLLPIAAQANLPQVVAFEFERFTPFKRDSVYYSDRILSREPGSGRLNLELVVVQRSNVDDLVRAARRLGLLPARVEVSGSRLPVDLRATGDSRQPFERLVRIAVVVLAGTACALAIGAIAIPMFQAKTEAAHLTAEVAQVRRQADTAQQLRKEIDAEIENRQSIGARKTSTPTVSELLGSLTHLLPDDAWLTELQVSGGTVQISGFANSATALLSLLDQSPLLSNAAFRSSVTQDTDAARERFDISAQIRSKPDTKVPGSPKPDARGTKP
jgi:general secretion pathway protein L